MNRQEFIEAFQTYSGISGILRENDHLQILSFMAETLSADPEKLAGNPCGEYAKGRTAGAYYFVLEDLVRNAVHYDWVYEMLADALSKDVFTKLIQYRLLRSAAFLEKAYEEENGQCVDEPFADCGAEELLVDSDGLEIQAVIGAKSHIRRDHPKIAVCICRMIGDMWEIPRLIHAIDPGYQFYLRLYRGEQDWRSVLYAVPAKGTGMSAVGTADSGKAKKVVAMAPYERGWSNVELIKDCGLIPYLLYKNHGHDVSMVGAETDRYVYHEKYTKGVKMEFLPGGQIEDKLRYLWDHAAEIDGLLLRGCYPTNFPVAKAYKYFNPNGRIYVGLDANSWWMDRILWDDADFMEFMDNCDVIATSGRALQRYLNEKWPWKIEYIPNGQYDFTGCFQRPDFRRKENVILTVGRLGTEQKATEVLLEAFAKIAGRIPEWQLRLVGSAEEAFGTYRERYFDRFPGLRERVCFAGSIADREKLAEEYRRAKIFALPSVMEGGTPNVIAEALYAGCAIAATEWDAYEDATDQGRCGLSCAIGDIDGFADVLYQLCRSGELEKFSEHAYQYSRINFDMEKITAKVNELLFGGRL